MTLRLGDTAPDFEVETTNGKIRFHDWIGDSWCFFFSHPADFTPVCTTELGQTAKLSKEFETRNVKCLGLSTDTVESHNKWILDVNDTQNTSLEFPIVADSDRKVAELYEMIHPEQSQTVTVRSVFIIDPNKKIRLMMTYPMQVGRNYNEILRAIDALQLVDEKGVVLPADWSKGDKVIIPPTVSNEEAEKLFPQGWDEQRPYLRLTEL